MMPMCTYLDDHTLRQYDTEIADDADLMEWLTLVRKLTGREWHIGRRVERHGWFLGPLERVWYTVYLHTVGPEYQVINLFYDGSGPHMLPHSNRASVLNYLIGIVSGCDGLNEDTNKETK